MVLAKDMMHTSTPILSFDVNVPKAIEYFQLHNHGWVAISASSDRFHGVLTEAGMVRVWLRYQTQKEREALILYRDLLDPIQLINENEVFAEVVKKLMIAVGHRVFVINSAGNVVGHISAKDVLACFHADPIGGSKALTQDESLKSHLYLYESFFSKSPFMMHSVNQKGEIQMANEMLHAMLGYSYGELIGKTIFDLYSKEVHKLAAAGIKTIFAKGYHKVVQSQMMHKNGSLVDVELVSRVLEDQNKQPIGTITVSRPMNMESLIKALPAI